MQITGMFEDKALVGVLVIEEKLFHYKVIFSLIETRNLKTYGSKQFAVFYDFQFETLLPPPTSSVTLVV